MHVDRKRFLMLTASIAAACGPSQKEGHAPVTVAQPIEIEPSPGDEPGPGDPLEESLQPDPAVRGGNDEDFVARCRALKPPPGPHCESFYDTKSLCETFAGALELEAADRATECLASRSGTEAICSFDAVEQCFKVGVRGYSSEPKHSSQCRSVVQRCSGYRWASGDLTMATCSSALAAVKDGLESRMISCIAEGCGIGSCVWDLSNR